MAEKRASRPLDALGGGATPDVLGSDNELGRHCRGRAMVRSASTSPGMAGICDGDHDRFCLITSTGIVRATTVGLPGSLSVLSSLDESTTSAAIVPGAVPTPRRTSGQYAALKTGCPWSADGYPTLEHDELAAANWLVACVGMRVGSSSSSFKHHRFHAMSAVTIRTRHASTAASVYAISQSVLWFTMASPWPRRPARTGRGREGRRGPPASQDN